jgi:hypothetical protein
MGIEHFRLAVGFDCVTAVMTGHVPQWNCVKRSRGGCGLVSVAPSRKYPKCIGTRDASQNAMTSHTEGTIIVRITTNHITLPLLAGATALTIAAAPSASAPQHEQPCSGMGGSTQCQRTGNVQIHTTPWPMTTPSSTYGCIIGANCG